MGHIQVERVYIAFRLRLTLCFPFFDFWRFDAGPNSQDSSGTGIFVAFGINSLNYKELQNRLMLVGVVSEFVKNRTLRILKIKQRDAG